MALYIEHVCSNVEVYLNGAARAQRRPHDASRSRSNCNHPQLVGAAGGADRAGVNTLDIKVAGHPLERGRARASAPAGCRRWRSARSRCSRRATRCRSRCSVSVPQAVSATLLLMGGFMFVLGFINRRESHLAYFGALSVGWALIEARLWLRDLPFENCDRRVPALRDAAAAHLAAVQFLLRYARWRCRIDRRRAAAAVRADAGEPGARRPGPAATRWPASGMCCSRCRCWPRRSATCAASTRHASAASGRWRRCWRRPRWRWRVEFVRAVNRRPSAGWRTVAQLVVPMMFVLVGLRLLQQHGRALQQAEEGKAQLELRVREATAEIERNFTPAGRTARRAGHRARAQAHRRRPARRPGRQAADDRAHQRVRAHQHAGARGAGGDAAVGARPDRQAGAADRRARRLARRGRVAAGAGRHRGRLERAARRPAADAVGARLRADDAHPARGGQQRHQAQRRDALLADAARSPTATSSWSCRTTATAFRWNSTVASTAATAWPA